RPRPSPALTCGPPQLPPPRTSAPPIPVPTATYTTSRNPRPAPKRPSPIASAFTSLSTYTGCLVAALTVGPNGIPVQPGRLGLAWTITPRVESTSPAVPMPTARTSGFSVCNRSTCRLTASITACGPSTSGVGTVRGDRTSPSEVTIPAAIFVPPISTPITASLMMFTLPQARVKNIAHAVANKVKGHHQTGNRHTRKQPHPPLVEKVDADSDHAAPLRRSRLRAEAEKAQACKCQDGVANVQCHQNYRRGNRVGQQSLQQNI